MARRTGTAITDRLRRLIPGRIRRSYAAKFVIGLALVILVIGAIGGAVYVQTNDRLTEATQERLQTESALQAEGVHHWQTDIRETGASLAAAGPVVDGSPAERTAFLRDRMAQGTHGAGITAIHYYEGADGTAETVLDGGTALETDAEGLPWASIETGGERSASDQGAGADGHHGDEGAIAGTVLTRPYESPVTGRPAIGVVSAVPGSSARLVVVVDLPAASSALRQSTGDAFAHVVNDRGTVVLSERTDQIGGQNMGPDDQPGVDSMAVERGLAGESGYIEMSMGGERMAMGYAPIEGTDWVSMSHVPASVAFALNRDISLGLLLLLLEAVLGLAVIGLAFGRGTIASLDRIAGQARALEAGELDTPLETDREDEFGELVRTFDSMRVSLREKIAEAEEARERAEAARASSAALVEHLEETAADYSRTMAATADGDLTRRLDPDVESDAMAEIAESFNAMLDDLEGTVGSVVAFAETVTGATDRVTGSIEEVRSAGEEVTVSIQEISEGADAQASSLQEASDVVTDLAQSVEEVADASDGVAETSRRAAERGAAGREAAGAAIESMDRIDRLAEETAETAVRVDEEMAAVGEVVELIDGIASQTSILALNASIEAARAGDAGDGFAVVADQVKALAEDTREATTEIEDRLTELGERTEQSVADAERMRSGIEAGTEDVEEAAAALETIVDEVEAANAEIQGIDAATDEQAAQTRETLSMVESVTATSERVSREAETVAAAAQEQAASLSEVTGSVTRLAQRADELERALSTFTVEDTESAGAGGDAPEGEPGRADD